MGVDLSTLVKSATLCLSCVTCPASGLLPAAPGLGRKRFSSRVCKMSLASPKKNNTQTPDQSCHAELS